MNYNRREFLKHATAVTLLGTLPGTLSAAVLAKHQPSLRIIIASDSHYGQPDTDSTGMALTFIEKANAFSAAHPCDFCVLNGDLFHDNPALLPQAKTVFDGLNLPYYVTKGNHDKVSDQIWENTWGMPSNLSFRQKNAGFILANTSNEKGEYLSPDLAWLKQQLSDFSRLKAVVLILHIPQAKWTANGIDNPDFFALLSNFPNVKAVFHGHEHDQDDVKLHNGIPYIFDSHIGGSWGTPYRGFRVLEISKKGRLVTYMMNPDSEKSRTNL